MPTVVVGTAGHIDHGKTTLLRALTGIDADRLPEERERGMTIDVGFAHLDLDDGTAIDFVDVPGHDRLVGNMLVGAGEIDAVLLVIAADDGPRAQTLEHLELLDALRLRRAVVAVTKLDAVDRARIGEVEQQARDLVDRTSMAGAPIVAVSATAGDGIPELRGRLVELRDQVQRDLEFRPRGPMWLAIDRAFTVRGRGTVVTGTLRGGVVRAGATLQVQPSDEPLAVRVREVQVHHGRTDRADGGRTALNLSGVEATDLRRGQVLTDANAVIGSDRLLVALRRPMAQLGPAPGSTSGSPPGSTAQTHRPWPPRVGAALRLHLWTESVEAQPGLTAAAWVELPGLEAEAAGQGPRDDVAAIARLGHPIAVLPGARGVLRDPGSSRVVAGLTVLDPRPPRGASRRRMTPARLAALATRVVRDERGHVGTSDVGASDIGTSDVGASDVGAEVVDSTAGDSSDVDAALLDLHGFRAGELAPDVRAALEASATILADAGTSVAGLRSDLGRELRRLVTVERGAAGLARAAIDQVVADLVATGRLARVGERLIAPARRTAADDALGAAMSRLESLLDANVPPPLAEAMRAAGCSPEGFRRLESAGRVVRVDDDLAWSAGRHAVLRDLAVTLARRGPVTPAAFRDAIGGNRRIALAVLEDLGRRGVLRRTDAGHLPGPRA